MRCLEIPSRGRGWHGLTNLPTNSPHQAESSPYPLPRRGLLNLGVVSREMGKQERKELRYLFNSKYFGDNANVIFQKKITPQNRKHELVHDEWPGRRTRRGRREGSRSSWWRWRRRRRGRGGTAGAPHRDRAAAGGQKGGRTNNFFNKEIKQFRTKTKRKEMMITNELLLEKCKYKNLKIFNPSKLQEKIPIENENNNFTSCSQRELDACPSSDVWKGCFSRERIGCPRIASLAEHCHRGDAVVTADV